MHFAMHIAACRKRQPYLNCIVPSKKFTSAPRIGFFKLGLFAVCLLGNLSTARSQESGVETVVIDDPLQNKTEGAQVGGAFTSEGYQPGLGQNHILYKLPHTVREGYAEFEVKGMNSAVIPENADHAFLAMYDGRGVSEPAQYIRDLKSNFYRWNVHWRQNRNALKCVISCAAPDPERKNAATAQYTDNQRDWSEEPTGTTVNWDAQQWYRFRVEWKDRTFRLLVNSEEKWRQQGPYDYAPVDHRIWLGSAPANANKYRCHVSEIVYRNFKLVAFGGAEAAPARSGVQPTKLFFPPPGESLADQERRQPSEVGLKADVVARLKAVTRAGRWALWRHGRLVHAQGDFNQLVEVKSLRKTWHALAVGAAIAQGKIPSLQQKLGVWLPELHGKDAEATWWHLITQTTGFDYPYGEHPPYKPGQMWTYSDKNPLQLCNALARVYGRRDSTDDYDSVIRQAYFDAIGLRGWKTSNRQDGVRFHFDLEDLGRLGLLVAARGEWKGQQIIPREFVEALETKQTRGIPANYDGPDDGRVDRLYERRGDFRESPYGYMTWVNTDCDFYPGADRSWAFGAGAGGSYVLWNHRFGIVFAGFGVDSGPTKNGIPHTIEACIAGPDRLAQNSADGMPLLSEGETDGKFLFEAEGYTRLTRGWEKYADPTARGQAFMKAQFRRDLDARIEYAINFQKAGWYRVWLRCRSTGEHDNDCFVMLDGAPASLPDDKGWMRVSGIKTNHRNWDWDSQAKTENHTALELRRRGVFVEVRSPGEHLLQLGSRAPDFHVDAIALVHEALREKPKPDTATH